MERIFASAFTMITLQSHHTGIEIRNDVTTSARSQAFNRTTLELKYFQFCFAFSPCTTFNRTTLELKCLDDGGDGFLAEPFNRTTLELKYKWNNLSEAGQKTFNRTTLELKYV